MKEDENVKNIWLEVDEPRKHFFKVAYPLLSAISHAVRNGKMDELYRLYEAFAKAYKRLDTLIKLYDKSVAATFDGVEAAIALYCPQDQRFDEIFVYA